LAKALHFQAVADYEHAALKRVRVDEGIAGALREAIGELP
jgi:hypothetical protein